MNMLTSVQVPMQTRSLGAGVIGNYELPHVGTGNLTQVLWRAASTLTTEPPHHPFQNCKNTALFLAAIQVCCILILSSFFMTSICFLGIFRIVPLCLQCSNVSHWIPLPSVLRYMFKVFVINSFPLFSPIWMMSSQPIL